MSIEKRRFPQILALAIALGGTLALAACQQRPVDSADAAMPSAEEQQAPPPAEPNPSAPSDESGDSAAPAADAANTAPPTDDGATSPVAPPADADASAGEGESPPPPADEGKKPEENK